MKLVVTGGRHYGVQPSRGPRRDFATVERESNLARITLDDLHAAYGIELIVQGGATGADALARRWASLRGVLWAGFNISPARWKSIGGSAGPMRNQVMLEVVRPDLVLAFTGGRGTADCVDRARSMGIPVKEVQP